MICQTPVRIFTMPGNSFLQGDSVPSILSKMHKFTPHRPIRGVTRAKMGTSGSSLAHCLYIASEFKVNQPTPPFPLPTYPHPIHLEVSWLYGLWEEISWIYSNPQGQGKSSTSGERAQCLRLSPWNEELIENGQTLRLKLLSLNTQLCSYLPQPGKAV